MGVGIDYHELGRHGVDHLAEMGYRQYRLLGACVGAVTC